MENTSSAQSEQLMALLVKRVEDNRDDLIGHYLGVLREALFSSRAEIRPSALKVIAAEEVEVLLRFSKQPEASAVKRGEQLHQAGLPVGAVLRMGQVTRQFVLEHSEDGQLVPILKTLDAYEMGVIEGFVRSIDDTNLIERAQLERVLTALQQRGEG